MLPKSFIGAYYKKEPALIKRESISNQPKANSGSLGWVSETQLKFPAGLWTDKSRWGGWNWTASHYWQHKNNYQTGKRGMDARRTWHSSKPHALLAEMQPWHWASGNFGRWCNFGMQLATRTSSTNQNKPTASAIGLEFRFNVTCRIIWKSRIY